VSARAAVVTISTSVARGEGEDVSGPALVRLCEQAGLDVQHEVVSDDRESIVAALKRLADHEGVRFVFTTGGTGLTIDDVTPEATRSVIEREAPGYAEAIRADSRDHTPLGLLTRGVSGVRGRTLIVNLPGNPKAIEQSWPIVGPTLEHAAQLLERSA
jgi:molybdopterin adenylyltransferase